MADRPYLIDVTRLVARHWSGRQSNGIDRVCDAYFDHFHAQALATLQLHGLTSTLDARQSDDLFDLLTASTGNFRARFSAFLPRLLVAAGKRHGLSGRTYINVSHSDFDLPAHHRWIAKAGLRSIYFIHDLIPTSQPELSRPYAVKRNRNRARSALLHGDGIIVSSQIVADDLSRFAKAENLPASHILVAPIAGKQLLGDECKPDKSAVPSGPYFLNIGTIEPRKNHHFLLDIWEELVAEMGDAAPQLVLVGQTGPMSRDVLPRLKKARHLQSFVRHIPECSDDDLALLLANARGLLMPTLAEGFGLPMVEALQAGVPVIANDLPVLREVGQGIAAYREVDSPSLWLQAIREYAQDGPERGRQMAALATFQPPNWRSHFTAVEQWLKLPETPLHDANSTRTEYA